VIRSLEGQGEPFTLVSIAGLGRATQDTFANQNWQKSDTAVRPVAVLPWIEISCVIQRK
jgi:hypothetical protein